MMNFYHRFIPHCADISRPLHTLLTTTKPKQAQTWNDTTLKAFNTIKQAMTDASPILSQTRCSHKHHDWCFQLCSRCCTTATDQQELETYCLFLKTLKPAETKYSIFGRELLAVYLFSYQTFSTFHQRTAISHINWSQTAHLCLTIEFWQIHTKTTMTPWLYFTVYKWHLPHQ